MWSGANGSEAHGRRSIQLITERCQTIIQKLLFALHFQNHTSEQVAESVSSKWRGGPKGEEALPLQRCGEQWMLSQDRLDIKRWEVRGVGGDAVW